MNLVLIFDESDRLGDDLTELLIRTKLARVEVVADPAAARAKLTTGGVAVLLVLVEAAEVLSSERHPGLALLRWTRSHAPGTSVVAILDRPKGWEAEESLRLGAYDLALIGDEPAHLAAVVGNALRHRSSAAENARLQRPFIGEGLRNPTAFSRFVTRSGAMRQIFVYLESVAGTGDHILISGETGVGKELVARGIHEAGGGSGAFVAVNLGGLDDHYFADTLFGHVRGAFTGAAQARAGLVRKAAGGTLFLDEFAEVSVDAQVKLLRLLDSGEYLPLGADAVERSRARVIMATNADLTAQVDSGRFRSDLFFRVTQHWTYIPPLRERPEDIAPITEHLMKYHASRLGLPAVPLTPTVKDRLESRPLPGNVREIEHLVVRALVNGTWPTALLRRVSAEVRGRDGESLGRDERVDGEGMAGSGVASAGVDRADADADGCDDPFGASAAVAFGDPLPKPRRVIEELLREADRRYPNNRARAAAALGLTPQAFANRWKRMVPVDGAAADTPDEAGGRAPEGAPDDAAESAPES